MRARIRNWLTVLGLIALFLAVQPYFRYEGGVTADAKVADHILANPGSMPFTEEYRFGWTESPLIHYRAEQSVVMLPNGGYTGKKSAGMTIGWMNWSSLTLAVGVSLLWVVWKLRPKAPTAQAVGEGGARRGQSGN